MGDFKLRNYQIESLEILDRELQEKQNVLYVAIMGAGKTTTICRLINTYYKETSRRFLILVNKQELVNQFKRDFLKKTEIPRVGVCCAGLGERIIDGRVVIATVQTFVNMMDEYKGCDLLILDEVHNVGGVGQYGEAINHLRKKTPNMRVLGMTATPYRLGHGMIYGNACVDPEKNLFDSVSHRITYERLLAEGYLAPLHGKVAHADSLGNDLSTVEINGDFVLNQLGEIMSKEIHLGTALQAIKEFCNDFKHICVFCCTISHATKLQKIINEFEPCTTVHSQLTPLERAGNMEAWKTGRVRIITSVNILAEGFDFPALDCLVFARPTLSARLFVQAIGRVLRISEGKQSGFLIDLTDNTHRFGTDIDAIKADVPKRVVEGKERKDDMFKFCPACFVEVHQALRKCNKCGFEWPAPDVVEATSVPEMRDVSFGPEPPVVVCPDEFMCGIWHSKKNGQDKWLGKISFVTDRFKFLSIWLCFSDYYSGYAINAGVKRWKEMGGFDPYPLNVEEFSERADKELILPSSLLVDVSGKWPEIIAIASQFENDVNDGDDVKIDYNYDDDVKIDYDSGDVPF